MGACCVVAVDKCIDFHPRIFQSLEILKPNTFAFQRQKKPSLDHPILLRCVGRNKLLHPGASCHPRKGFAAKYQAIA
jgi:hypothetical protein